MTGRFWIAARRVPAGPRRWWQRPRYEVVTADGNRQLVRHLSEVTRGQHITDQGDFRHQVDRAAPETPWVVWPYFASPNPPEGPPMP